MKTFGSLGMTALFWKHTNSMLKREIFKVQTAGKLIAARVSGEILCPVMGMQHPWLAEKHIILGLAICINKRLQQPAFYSYDFDQSTLFPTYDMSRFRLSASYSLDFKRTD